MPFFIAFSGKKQVGKDEAMRFAKAMLEKSGKRVLVTAFARPLKDMCIDILGLDPNCVYGTDDQKNSFVSHITWDNLPLDIRLKYSNTRMDHDGRLLPRSGLMTNREVLQIVGTDIFRTMFFDEVWAEAPFNKTYSGVDVVILTDCRFPNEVDAVEDNGGIIIRLTRDTGLNDSHVSETALDNAKWDYFDYEYYNNGTLEELNEYVRHVLTERKLI
jgi:hypothetical protein